MKTTISFFFRYDTPVVGNDEIPFYSHIGCVGLDRNFSVIDSCFTLETDSPFSEDPRVIQAEGGSFVVFNDLIDKKLKKRGIRMANFDCKSKKVTAIKNFDQKKFAVEKNWMPFSPEGQGLHFVYTISPHEVFQLPSENGTHLEEVVTDQQIYFLSFNDWPAKWGFPRGGTPPRLVDGEYLSFFHSAFDGDNGIVWYIMGAYTFEAEAPFRITGISRVPILFDGVYSTEHINTANHRVRCIYPAGFVLENRDGKDLIHLSCGENDSAVKILTLDKVALLESLKPVEFVEEDCGLKGKSAKNYWAPSEVFKR